MVIKTFNKNKKAEMEKFTEKFLKVFGYRCSVKAVQSMYICSIPDIQKNHYEKMVQEGRI